MTVLEKWLQVKAMTPQLIACMIIAIDLSNQQAFNADTKAMQQIDFTRLLVKLTKVCNKKCN